MVAPVGTPVDQRRTLLPHHGPARAAGNRSSRADQARWVRRLCVVAVALPVTFIIALQVAHPWIDRRWPSSGDMAISVLTSLAAIAFGTTICAFIQREHARRLHDERRCATVRERDRIAREMHDSLAQVLGLTHLRLRALRARSEVADEPAVTEELDELATICHEAYADVREAILGLRASAPDDRSLAESLQHYLDRYAARTGIHAVLEAPEEPVFVAPHDEVQVLRIIQESLTNTRKHADASRAVVRLLPARTGLAVEVEDDGRGFDVGGTSGPGMRDGFGLAAMRERAEGIDADLRISSAPGVGTLVRLQVPSRRPADAGGHGRWAR